MIRLLKQKKLGFEMYTVVYPSGQRDKYETKVFWSEEGARGFIGRKYPQIRLILVEGA